MDTQWIRGNYGVVDQQRGLRDFVSELRGWLYEVEQMGIPKFGETGYRLSQFRDSLAMHFETCVHECWECPNCQFEEESGLLMKRLDDLIRRLGMLEPPFASWQVLTRLLNVFSDDLEDLEHRFVDQY